jgi:hypothetical protein
MGLFIAPGMEAVPRTPASATARLNGLFARLLHVGAIVAISALDGEGVLPWRISASWKTSSIQGPCRQSECVIILQELFPSLKYGSSVTPRSTTEWKSYLCFKTDRVPSFVIHPDAFVSSRDANFSIHVWVKVKQLDRIRCVCVRNKSTTGGYCHDKWCYRTRPLHQLS